MNFNQYDVVKIVRLSEDLDLPEDAITRQRPSVGDVATILELYRSPEFGYELECVDSSGESKWLHSFLAEDVDLVLVRSAQERGEDGE